MHYKSKQTKMDPSINSSPSIHPTRFLSGEADLKHVTSRLFTLQLIGQFKTREKTRLAAHNPKQERPTAARELHRLRSSPPLRVDEGIQSLVMYRYRPWSIESIHRLNAKVATSRNWKIGAAGELYLKPLNRR